MQVDRSLHVCLLGEVGIGQSAFLQCFRGDPSGSEDVVERFVTLAELDGQPFCVRFTDTAGSNCFHSMWSSVLGTAHAVLLCYAVDNVESLQALKERWLPLFWSTRSEAPTFVLGLRADKRAKVSEQVECVSEEMATAFTQSIGAVGYLECSSFEPDSVQGAVDQVLLVAREYYSLQWQLGPRPQADLPPSDDTAHDAPWLTHERLNVPDDPKVLDVETVRQNLSMLGATPTSQHAYLRIDLADFGLTSIDAIRGFKHLQFVNLSGNRLRTLEPLGSLRCLLHLNASFNLLIRTQGFTAPDQLETIDVSYNMISDLGDWGVHKYLRELNLRGNFIDRIGPGLKRNGELRMLDLSENHLARIENMEGLRLHTFYLAQNRLTSLEGIGCLKKLEVLNVRHNCITSISALRGEDIPRLRKLCISENRISHIREVEGLKEFPYLCDLLLAPNPINELPFYREQVLQRLSRLRLLDKQAASAEEKVKADVIYGSDVDRRREIFEGQLPQETFVDRRLVTQEGIASMETSRFYCLGCAGEYGSNAEEPQDTDHGASEVGRTHFQESRLRQHLEICRCGGSPVGVADFRGDGAPFRSVRVFEDDLFELLEACAEGGIQRLLLSNGAVRFGADGLRELLAALQAPGPLNHIDLAGAEYFSEVLGEFLAGLPFDQGCSIEAANSGIPQGDVNRLRNATPAAAAALRKAEVDRERTVELCTEFSKNEEALEEFAAENGLQDNPPEFLTPIYHPVQWREGIEARALAAHKEFAKKNPNGVQEDKAVMSWSFVAPTGARVTLNKDEYQVLDAQRRRILTEWGYFQDGEETAGAQSRPLPAAFERVFEPVLESPNLIGFMVWTGARASKDQTQERQRQQQEAERTWKERNKYLLALTEAATKVYDASSRPPHVASAQLIAHFTYLSLSCSPKANDTLKPLTRFGLKWLPKHNRPRPRHGQDLHALLASGKVRIESIVGNGFGLDSLELTVQNKTNEDLRVAVQRGTIFQQTGWEHRQNLMVAVNYVLPLSPGTTLCKKMRTFSMNQTCAISRGHPLNLTEFFFDDSAALQSQGGLWDYFSACFTQED